MTRRSWLPLLLCASALAGQAVRPLTILHSNDLHARLSPEEDRGGFARLATAVKKEKANCAACLYLNAGDMVQGTPVSTLFHGRPVYEIANLLGLDAGTLGNHEFDYGWRRVREFARIAKFPIVSANVVNAKGESITGAPYVIKTVGGIRVAIIGAVLGDLSGNSVTPEQVGPWQVLPVVETVRKQAQALRAESDLVVVLGHIHDQGEVDAILRGVPEVSVVVAGHNHVAYPAMMNVDGRVAVLVNSYGAELGRLDLAVDLTAKKLNSAAWKTIPIDGKYADDPAVKRLVDSWEKKVGKVVDVPIGESTMRMERDDPLLRTMIERAMAEQTGADIAWVALGNIRYSLPRGRLLARDIWKILPFDDFLAIGTFKGSQLPPAITDRYPVEADRQYTVAVTDFSVMNQPAKNQLGVTGLRFSRTGPLQRDAMIEWIKKKKVIP